MQARAWLIWGLRSTRVTVHSDGAAGDGTLLQRVLQLPLSGEFSPPRISTQRRNRIIKFAFAPARGAIALTSYGWLVSCGAVRGRSGRGPCRTGGSALIGTSHRIASRRGRRGHGLPSPSPSRVVRARVTWVCLSRVRSAWLADGIINADDAALRRRTVRVAPVYLEASVVAPCRDPARGPTREAPADQAWAAPSVVWRHCAFASGDRRQ